MKNRKNLFTKITNDLLLKITCLIMAFALWVVVMNVEDPINTRIYRNIPIVFKNESILTDNGRDYEIVPENNLINLNEPTVSVTIKAKRSVLSKITGSDIEAIGDFKNMEVRKLIPITIRVANFEDRVETATSDPTNIEIKIVRSEDSTSE